MKLLIATFALWSVVGLVWGQTVPDFEDVPEGHIAQPAIEWAVSNGITVGVGNNRFGMGETLTRYQMVTFLCRAFSRDSCRSGSQGSDKFDDVPGDHWANYAIGWAVNRAITSGVSATEFGGSRPLTREQMITFLYRAKGSLTGGSKGTDIYEDVPNDRSQWANVPIGWAFDQGITGGIAPGTFGFETTLAREEMVLFLCRAVAPEICVPSQAPIPLASSQARPSGASATCDFPDHVARVSEAVYQMHVGDGIGTAFYIGNDEWLTAAHVLQNQSTVILRRGSVSLTASVVGKDLDADLALLKAEGSNLRPLKFGNLSEIGQGHQVFSVGFPVYVASEPSVTSGVLSRIESDPDLGTLVLTDAAVSPGNSGGPLLNKCGEVIGLFVAKIVREDVEGLSYAVAESTLRERLPSLRSGNWTHFTSENLGGTEGYYLTATEHDVDKAISPPYLLLRCGISDATKDQIYIGVYTLNQIQSDVGDEGDVVVEYGFADSANPIAERWWKNANTSNDISDPSLIFADANTTQIAEYLRGASLGSSLWISIRDGISNDTYWMRFEVDGITAVLDDLTCWK